MRRIGAVLVCAAVVLGGCDDDPDDPDSGIILTDSGTPGTDAGGTCGPRQAPAPTATMVCLASTLDCLVAAANASAQQACIQADPNPLACASCLVAEQNATATMAGGCAPQYGPLDCCFDAQGCADGDLACQNTASMGACSTQAQAFGACVMTCSTARSCGISTLCFMPGTDGGTPDPDAGTDDDAGTASDAGTDDDAGGTTADAGVDAGA